MVKHRKRYRFKPRFWIMLVALFLFVATAATCLFLWSSEPEPKVYTSEELLEMGIPESLIDLYEKNEEARDFVLGYNVETLEPEKVNISKDVKKVKSHCFCSGTSVGDITNMVMTSWP